MQIGTNETWTTIDKTNIRITIENKEHEQQTNTQTTNGTRNNSEQ